MKIQGASGKATGGRGVVQIPDSWESTRIVIWMARIAGALVAAYFLLVFVGLSIWNPEDDVPGTAAIKWVIVLAALAIAVAWREPRIGGALTMLGGLALWGAILVYGESLVASPLADAVLAFGLFALPLVLVGGLFIASQR
jgi:hypothetical protein